MVMVFWNAESGSIRDKPSPAEERGMRKGGRMNRLFALLATAAFSCMLSAGIMQARAETKIASIDLAINGDSFFAMSNISSELERLARQEGYIVQNDSFRRIAVSGANGSLILKQYDGCTPKPPLLITDWGLIDMMQGCGDSPAVDCPIIKTTLNTLHQYISAMKAGGTRRFIFIRYPDAQGSQWANLKTNLDILMPEIEKICKTSSDPKCLWVDLRPIWEGHYDKYTSDGIHCTNAGGAATAAALWRALREHGILDIGRADTSSGRTGNIRVPGAQSSHVFSAAYSAGRIRLKSDRDIRVVRVFDIRGKAIFSWKAGIGADRPVSFPINRSARGVYSLYVSGVEGNAVLTVAVP
jgi:hypothetical protein